MTWGSELDKRTKRHRADTTVTAGAARRGVAWFTVFGLLFQLFLVTGHIHVDEDGWVGLPLLPGVAPLPVHNHDFTFHRHEDRHESVGKTSLSEHQNGPGSPAGGASSKSGDERVRHPDCQVCQFSPVVSASFFAATIEFALAPADKAAKPRALEIDAKRIEPRAHANPRAPPSQV